MFICTVLDAYSNAKNTLQLSIEVVYSGKTLHTNLKWSDDCHMISFHKKSEILDDPKIDLRSP